MKIEYTFFAKEKDTFGVRCIDDPSSGVLSVGTDDRDTVTVHVPVERLNEVEHVEVVIDRLEWLKMCMLFTLMAGEGSEKPT